MKADDGDPRSDVPIVRPMVARQTVDRSVMLFAIALTIAAFVLFYILESRRASVGLAETRPAELVGTIASPPDLAIPGETNAESNLSTYAGPQPSFAPFLRREAAEALPVPARSAPAENQLDEGPVRLLRPEPASFQPQPQPESRPVIRRPTTEIAEPEESANFDPDRRRPVRLTNPGTTVPMGTVIHAVLETALDSTRAGAARAIVSRDVTSFDGSRTLIPRGSRLIGQYDSDVARGQKRALIQWNRLMLPGGTMIDIDSPAADPLGRAGVKGDLDSHFFARFGGAILQSILDIGVQAAAHEVGGNTVVLNIPGVSQSQGLVEDIQPTLRVRHGSSVSVFVAHDLDFAEALP